MTMFGLIIFGMIMLAGCRAGVPAGRAAPPRRPLQVVGLGDSVPAAYGCGCSGFVEQSADTIGRLTRRQVVVHNDAVSGWTTADVVKDLKTGTGHDDLADGADLVIVEAGANDLDLGRITDPTCGRVDTSPCFRPELEVVDQALTKAVQLIRSTDPDHDPRIVLMGYWDVSVDGAVARRRGADYGRDSNELTLALNRVVRTVVARTGAIYVDAYTPLKGPDGGRDPSPYLLGDGDHPNRAGHRLLAKAVVSRLQQTGAIASWSRR